MDSLEEFKETDWYKERPELIKEAIELLPPTTLYKLKSSGKQCRIICYDEPKSGLIEDVTVIVEKSGIGGALSEMGLGVVDKGGEVSGIKLNELEEWLNEEES